MLNFFETSKNWPQSFLQWKVTFIPKKTKGIPDLQQVRPIAISGTVYRAWGRAKLSRLAAKLATLMAPFQAGGVKGVDPEVLVLALDLSFDTDTWPCLACLDYAKVLDSADAAVSLAVFRKLGLPERVIALLEAQWLNHTRWITFGACVHPVGMKHCKGLPQGDVFSPFA